MKPKKYKGDLPTNTPAESFEVQAAKAKINEYIDNDGEGFDEYDLRALLTSAWYALDQKAKTIAEASDDTE